MKKLKKKILVAGGAGFVGSHLCEKLFQQGHEIFCVDNFFTGREENIAHLMEKEFFHVIRQDICDPLDLEVEEIYNLACPASPVHYQAAPIQTVKTSVYGAINLLELAKRRKTRILQASTSEIYGDPDMHPQKEEYWGHVNPIGIRSCYDEGKRCAETLFFDYWRCFGVEVKVARIFNTYGPNMQMEDGRVVSNFIVQALKGEPLTIYGEGKQTRAFCYVDDLIVGLIALMESEKEILGPINLGNPHEFTILELAETVLKLTNSSSKITFKELPEDDPKQRKPDITKAKNFLGWTPRVDLREGLQKTIVYFQKVLEESFSL